MYTCPAYPCCASTPVLCPAHAYLCNQMPMLCQHAHPMPCHAMPCHAMHILCHAHAMPCHAMPCTCYAMHDETHHEQQEVGDEGRVPFCLDCDQVHDPCCHGSHTRRIMCRTMGHAEHMGHTGCIGHTGHAGYTYVACGSGMCRELHAYDPTSLLRGLSLTAVMCCEAIRPWHSGAGPSRDMCRTMAFWCRA